MTNNFICVNTYDKAEVGDIRYATLTDANSEWHDVTIKIMALATQEDYIKYVKENSNMPIVNPIAPYFYWISMD